MRRLLVVLRHRAVLVVVIVVAALGAAYLGSPRTSVYQSEAILYVGQHDNNLQPATEAAQAVLAQTFSQIVGTQTVVAAAISDYHIPRQTAQVVQSTTAVAPPGTNLIRLTVADHDPVVAQSLANGIATVFAADAQTLAPLTSSATGQSAGSAPVTIAQKATLPLTPLATRVGRNVALGGVAGLLIAVVLVLLVDFLGLPARTPRQLEDQLEMPVIGIVPLQASVAQGAGGRGVPLLAGENG
ncbi:MAG: Wzz/FepE/Etk N-terminal domain-containing protein [Acidimicrobiales bacterium]